MVTTERKFSKNTSSLDSEGGALLFERTPQTQDPLGSSPWKLVYRGEAESQGGMEVALVCSNSSERTVTRPRILGHPQSPLLASHPQRPEAWSPCDQGMQITDISLSLKVPPVSKEPEGCKISGRFSGGYVDSFCSARFLGVGERMWS